MNHSHYIASPFVEECYRRFREAKAAQNYGLACDAFVEAIKYEPTNAYRRFVSETGGIVAASADYTSRNDEIVELLDNSFEANPHMHLMYYGKPELVDYFSRVREDNIQKGLPPVLLITQGKSGSISLASIFTSGCNMPSYAYSFVTKKVVPAWARDYARGGACYVTHLEPTLQNVERLKMAGIQKIIVHVRDPRQTLVSLVYHVIKYGFSHKDLKMKEFEGKSIQEQVWDIRHKYLNTLEWLEGWLGLRDQLTIKFSTFEQFIDHKENLITEYLDFFGIDKAHFNYEQATTLHEGTDYHFRKGVKDEWREVIPPEYQDMLNVLLKKEIKEFFGWPEK